MTEKTRQLPPEAYPQTPPYYEVVLGRGHTPTACGPVKRQILRPPVLRSLPKN